MEKTKEVAPSPLQRRVMHHELQELTKVINEKNRGATKRKIMIGFTEKQLEAIYLAAQVAEGDAHNCSECPQAKYITQYEAIIEKLSEYSGA